MISVFMYFTYWWHGISGLQAQYKQSVLQKYIYTDCRVACNKGINVWVSRHKLPMNASIDKARVYENAWLWKQLN